MRWLAAYCAFIGYLAWMAKGFMSEADALKMRAFGMEAMVAACALGILAIAFRKEPPNAKG